MTLTASLDMAKKKGRPKGAGRITTRFSMVASPEYLDWLVRYAIFKEQPETSDAVRAILRASAEADGFEKPPMR